MGVGGNSPPTGSYTHHPTAPAPASMVEKPPTGLDSSLTAGNTGLPSGTAFYMNYSYNLDMPDHYLVDDDLGDGESNSSEDSNGNESLNMPSFEEYRDHALKPPASRFGKTKPRSWRRELE
ncbi:hypothetical protein LTR78_009662 [Recurvomyces mirabilis]|uniref:Uncharacterized protein n=1 Tax=Recurvomyces mirabilis TaxID=574656 RepID=A0AAE0TRD9_9PEZI|nr:hypothetical protein LTR78_009662 [Recurvomyces mirabilis]KAK5150296.1 hypothetical protein LTS14_010273 [Recurvomyces mirabilis]